MEKLAYTIKEAAEATGVSKAVLYKLTERGEIPSAKFGESETCRVLIPAKALRDWIDSHMR